MSLVEYIPLATLSAINRVRIGHVQIAIRAYCDGSGDPRDANCQYLTLGACLATPSAWSTFETLWANVLARHDSPPLHMTDAQSLNGDFTDWRRPQVDALVTDIYNQCFSHVAYAAHRDDFYLASCTINMEDYRRAAKESSGVRSRTPQALCTYHVAAAALMMLPDDSTKPLKKDGMLEVFFDRGERFLHVLQKEWERRKKNRHDDVVSLIAMIEPVDYREVVGVQAADFLAWHVNRYYVTGSVDAGVISRLAAPNIQQYWQYENLMRAMPDGWTFTPKEIA